MHRRHTQDLGPLLPSQLSTDDAVDSRSDGVASLVDEHAGVVIEADDRAVRSLQLLLGPHDDGVADVSALDLVRSGGGPHTGVGGISLLLYDGYYSVACRERKC
jgi:hypothetical protein